MKPFTGKDRLWALPRRAKRKGFSLVQAASVGFSLIELLTVIAIVSVLAVVTVPAFNSIRGGMSFSQATGDISGVLEQARAYAMGNNTYVYVGLQEVDGVNPTASNGTGRVVLAVVASSDGTRPYGNSPAALTTKVSIIAKPLICSNTHLFNASHSTTSDGMSNSGGMTNRVPFDSTFIDLGDSTAISTVTFTWPLTGTARYNFSKVIEFDPQGAARVQMASTFSSSIPSYIEIPLVPARGNSVPAAAQINQAALQISGITGGIRTYRP